MLIDVHCHVNLYLILDEILNEAREKGVEKIIGVSMSEISIRRILEISNKYDSVYPALGIHPEEISNNKNIEQNLNKICDQIVKNQDKLCAIGEIGLDHHFVKDRDLYPLQELIFKRMLNLAQDLNLPVNIHSKGAEQKVFELLESYSLPNVNIHWYSGPEKYLKVGIDRGYYFSITPAISFSPKLKNLVSIISKDKLLLESDGPIKFSGITGTPSMVKDVLSRIAKIKNIEKTYLENQIFENTKKVFPRIF